MLYLLSGSWSHVSYCKLLLTSFASLPTEWVGAIRKLSQGGVNSILAINFVCGCMYCVCMYPCVYKIIVGYHSLLGGGGGAMPPQPPFSHQGISSVGLGPYCRPNLVVVAG
jgi:hypothetical protein